MDLDRLRDTARLISGKWCLTVLDHTMSGPKGHNELARLIGIDHTQLGRTLRGLQQAGLLVRHVDADGTPIRVNYSLTQRGRETLILLGHLAYWHGGQEACPMMPDLACDADPLSAADPARPADPLSAGGERTPARRAVGKPRADRAAPGT